MTPRLLPSLFLQLVSIAWAWDFVIAGLGQGATYVVAGWWASLLGLVVLVMALAIPTVGLLAGLLASLFFRVPEGTPVSDDAIGDLVVSGGLLYTLAYLATGVLLWQFAPAAPSEHAGYGTGFIVVVVCVMLGFGFAASMATSWVIARRGLPVKP